MRVNSKSLTALVFLILAVSAKLATKQVELKGFSQFVTGHLVSGLSTNQDALLQAERALIAAKEKLTQATLAEQLAQEAKTKAEQDVSAKKNQGTRTKADTNALLQAMKTYLDATAKLGEASKAKKLAQDAVDNAQALVRLLTVLVKGK